MLQIIYWWHPLLWLANARIRRLREEAVDDAVMLALRDEGPNYAPTLLEVARLALARPMLSLGLVGIIESRSALSHRIERLVNFTAPRRAGLSAVSIVAVVALTAAAVPMAEAPPQPLPTVTVATKPTQIRAESSLYSSIDDTPNSGDVVAKGSNPLLTVDNVIVDRNAGTMTASGQVKRTQGTNVENGVARRIVMTSPGRKALMEKLDQIRIDSISFQAKPLPEVIVELSEKIRQADPTKHGINLLLQPDRQDSKVGTIDPQTGEPIAAAPADDSVKLDSILVTIDPPMVNARLVDVLNAIVAAAPQVKYSLLNEGVAFTTREAGSDLHIRKYKVDNQRFASAIGLDPINPSTNLVTRFTAISNFFARAGVNLAPERGRNVFWSADGDLMLRATPDELNKVEEALALSGGAIPGDPGQSPPAKFHANELVQDGRLLFASGKLDEAEVKFKQAADLDPKNQAASFYLAEIQRARQNPNAESTSVRRESVSVRLFKLNRYALVGHLQEAGLLEATFPPTAAIGDSSKVRNLVEAALISKFAGIGVDLRPETGKNIHWDDRASTLLVRAPASDLDAIEPVLSELNPPQIHVQAKVIELPEKIANQIWATWAPTNTAGAQPWSGVLSHSQTKDLLKQLESLGKVSNLLSESSVTTLSGRQAQIQLLDVKFIYSGISNGLPTAQQYPIGTTLDVVPSATSDNQSIQFVVTPTIMEFLGYEDSKGGLSKPDPLNPPMPPMPHFRIRQMQIDRTLLDGSTLMLGHPTVQRMVVQNSDSHMETASEDSQHNLLVLVTPILITATGERVHPDH